MFSLFFAAYLLQATYADLFKDGHALLEQGNAREAESVLKQSASLNPSYLPALKDLAEAYVKLKRFPDAAEQYQRVIGINPKDTGARGRLAELYSWIGNHDKSIVTYRDALDIDPGNLGLKTGLAKVLRWSNRYDEAERLYKEVLERDRDHHEALKGLAKTYSMNGDLKSSIETLDKALRLYPDDAELHKDIGTVLAWQRDYAKALVSLQKAVDLAPDYMDAYRTTGDVYIWMKAYKQAVAPYKKAVGLEPNNVENHILLATAYANSGNRSLAEEAVKAALRIDPADSRALKLLRAVKEEGRYPIVKDIGEAIELGAFAVVFVILLLISRSKKRMLRRRHRLYYYFIKYALPSLVVATFISFVSKDYFSGWLNIVFLEELTEAVLFLSLSFSFFALLWSEHRQKEFSRMVILAVGAHPDDIELGCGAFIMKAKDSGAAVYGLTMSRGERGTDRNGKREEEFRRAAWFMELDGYWIMDFPDTGLQGNVAGMKDIIEEKIKEAGATLVLTHTSIDLHTDHQAVFEASKVAARNISMLCYEDVSTPREFVPNYFVDVSPYIEDKMKLIAFHRTQEEKPYMDPEVIKGRAAHRGIQSGLQYAEAFRIHKLLR